MITPGDRRTRKPKQSADTHRRHIQADLQPENTTSQGKQNQKTMPLLLQCLKLHTGSNMKDRRSFFHRDSINGSINSSKKIYIKTKVMP